MGSSLVFGVGCYFFPLREGAPAARTIPEYIEDVESFLCRIANVTNVQVHTDTGFPGMSITPVADSMRICYDENPYPVAPACEFELHIPFRVQDQLDSRLAVENIRVTIIDAFYCPVTFVEPVGSSDYLDGSESVALAWRFLKCQNENAPSSNVQFDLLGPSPFHADFEIKASREPKQDMSAFTCTQVDRYGYRRFELLYSTDRFATIEEAKEHIFRKLSDELAVYYQMMYVDNQRNRRWEDISQRYQNLDPAQNMKRLKRWIRKLSYSSRLRDFFVSITQFESSDILLMSRLRYRVRPMYDASYTGLRTCLEEALQDMMEFPTSKLMELARFLEGRRQQSVQTWVVLVSALIGGIVGSLISTLISRIP